MLNHCSAMQSDIQAFVANPTDTTQSAAQESFLPCYQSWNGLALFFQQPFDLADKKPFQNLIDLIDTHPFLPGYIDGIPEYPYSGLVHELDIDINADNLRGQHRLMDEESASVGFPVIEFFLWKMPVTEHWQATPNTDNATIVDRRKAYLSTATDLLMEHLTQAVLRWQTNGTFASLPERAQFSFVLKSLQRLSMIELLAGQFEEAVFTDPGWYHTAPFTGFGRSFITIKLKSMQQVIGDSESNEFSAWLDKNPELPFTASDLHKTLTDALTAVSALPENYPFDSSADEQWQAARQQLAQLTVYFSQLSKHFQVTIVTE
nr:imelysin family protein [Reinekea sp. G2M2-21]